MLRSIYKVTLAGSLGLLTSCGEADKLLNKAVEFELGPAKLRGTWLGNCIATGEAYSQVSMVFLSEALTYKSTRYSDAACTQEADLITARGSFALGEMKKADKGELTPIDFIFDTLTWKFTSQPALAVDWAALCGGSLITSGLISVLGGACEVDEVSLNFAAEQFGALYFKDEKIYVTDLTLNGATAATRPTALDLLDGALTKQPEIP